MPIEHTPTRNSANAPNIPTTQEDHTEDHTIHEDLPGNPPDSSRPPYRYDDSEAQAYAVRAVKTCTFWRDHAKTWFNQLEAKFRAHNVRSDELKFCVVVDNLDKESMIEIADIIESPPSTDKYNKLKETLINRLTDSDEKRWKKLLTDVELGDRKPTHLLREMKRLTSNAVDEQLLRTLWMQRLPTRVQEILSIVEGVPLDKLAELADKAIERTNPAITTVTNLSTTETDAGTSSSIEKLTQQLQTLVTAMEKGRWPRSKSRGRRNRSRSVSRNRANPGKYCYYHTRFGEKARNCEQPCTWIKALTATNTPSPSEN